MSEPDEDGFFEFLVRTVGGPAPGDARDGALHQLMDYALPDSFDLEPLEAPFDGPYAHYVRSSAPPERDDENNPVWIYEYREERT